MKKLRLETEHYQSLLEAFNTWLQALNYAEKTQESWTIHLQEYLHFHESNNIKHITKITPKDHQRFQMHIQSRSNETQGGGLSQAAVNKILTAINAFRKFLSFSTHHQIDVGYFDIKQANHTRTILTIKEVKQLYEATFRERRESSFARGQRDRVMIAVFYGCGLRMSEGRNLNLSDVDTDNKILLVREGKGKKSRQIPIARIHNEDIKKYIGEGRNWFEINHKQKTQDRMKKGQTDSEALFLNCYGMRMQSSGFYYSLQQLIKTAELQKYVTLHGLRHSIATHLLASGMNLESIKDFLGHATLDSTQIYTHIAQEYEDVQKLVRE